MQINYNFSEQKNMTNDSRKVQGKYLFTVKFLYAFFK